MIFFRPRLWAAGLFFTAVTWIALALPPFPLAHALEPSPAVTNEQLVKLTATALDDGRPGHAIHQLEAFADRGIVHPDLSFNRALAYLARAKTPTAQPGDWGQAAAAFAEALQLRPDDLEAKRGLEEVQIAVAKRASSKNSSADNTHLDLGARFIQALSPVWLFVLGAIASLALIYGLFSRRSASETRRVAGSVSVGVGAFILVTTTLFSTTHALLYADARTAVVVSQRAPILDEAGATIKGHLPLRQSTLVQIGSTTRGLVPLIGFNSNAWLRVSQVRILAKQ